LQKMTAHQKMTNRKTPRIYWAFNWTLVRITRPSDEKLFETVSDGVS
jgi:hypothetical protein